jgi:hypothetical protein
MLYLVHPNRALSWIDLPASLIEKLPPGEPEFDLAQFEWLPATDTPTASGTIVRLALRHGASCTGGLVFSAHLVNAARRPTQLREVIDRALGASSKLRGEDKLMEHLMPGWGANWEKTDAGIAKDVQRQIVEAEAELAELLAAPLVPELVEHWRLIRGFQPEPI